MYRYTWCIGDGDTWRNTYPSLLGLLFSKSSRKSTCFFQVPCGSRKIKKLSETLLHMSYDMTAYGFSFNKGRQWHFTRISSWAGNRATSDPVTASQKTTRPASSRRLGVKNKQIQKGPKWGSQMFSKCGECGGCGGCWMVFPTGAKWMRTRYMDRAQPFSIGTSPSNLGGCRWQPWFQTPKRIRKYRKVYLFGIIELFQKGRKAPIECNPTRLIWAPLLWNCNGGTAFGSHGLAKSWMTPSVESRSSHDLVIHSLYSQSPTPWMLMNSQTSIAAGFAWHNVIPFFTAV